jgi:hypothetical protein
MKFYGIQEDDLPLDQPAEEAQPKMGSRTAFFYGKSSDPLRITPSLILMFQQAP